MSQSFNQSQPAPQDPATIETILSEHLPVLGEQLNCDRCFLYVRNPQTQLGKVIACWRRHSEIPNIFDDEWKPEPASLPDEDPLFAAALRTDPSIFIEDVETASPKIVNKDFEHKTFGHRALIHAHLCFEGQLWGILQPCVFAQPRNWTNSDHQIIAQATQQLTPLVVAYIKQFSTHHQ
jgi:GAF domain-containing protein